MFQTAKAKEKTVALELNLLRDPEEIFQWVKLESCGKYRPFVGNLGT